MKQLTFFLDIDNTLLPAGQKYISEEVFSAIRAAKAGGSLFFINTARPHWLVPEEIFPSDIFDGICSGCGTHITYHGEVIYESYLSEERVRKIVSDIEKLKIPELTVVVEEKDRNFYYGHGMEWYVDGSYQKLGTASEIGTLYTGLKVQKLCFDKTAGDYPREVFSGMEKDFEVLIHPGYAEVVPKGFGKGAAINITERALNIPHSSTVAIGDSLNDAEMLKYAEISVAMGNAPENVKALCDIVTDTATNDGVARAIVKLMQNGGERPAG